MDVSTALKLGAQTLGEAGVEQARREASSLLCYVLKKEPVFVIAHPEYSLTENESDSYKQAVRRRALCEPFQYITGRQEFYGLEFEVDPAVLIPRPETEILVETALGILAEIERPSFLEIGVGSGCISVSILHNLPDAKAIGVDISAAALIVAERNAKRHNVSDRLTLFGGDLFAGVQGAFDLIVSNPPYIPDGDIETLQAEVGRFEPRSALAGGADGLDILRRIILAAPSFLKPGGALLMEIGFDQSDRVRDELDPRVWQAADFLADLQGLPRILRTRLA